MFAKYLRVIFRLFWSGITLFIYFPLQLLAQLLPDRYGRGLRILITSRLSRFFIFGFGGKVTYKGSLREVPKGALLICNHLSWLDPVVINTALPTFYVTSTDVKGHSFLGRITRLAGCYFVSRSSMSLKRELKELGSFFKQGHHLCFFPEATTSNGKELLPFKPALFDLALQNQNPVQVLTIKYTHVNNKAVKTGDLDELAYYGDKTFTESLSSVISLKSWQVEVIISDLLLPQDFEGRKPMCQKAREIIEENYLGKKQSDVGLNEFENVQGLSVSSEVSENFERAQNLVAEAK